VVADGSFPFLGKKDDDPDNLLILKGQADTQKVSALFRLYVLIPGKRFGQH
jgi:hypothetical protein